MTAQEIHDQLMAQKPEGASHDQESCTFCNQQENPSKEDKLAEAIFTQEQHEQLLAAAVEKAQQSATTDADAEILALNEKLQAAENDLKSRDEEITQLKGEISSRDEKDRLDKLAGERVEKVKEVANFSEEQLDARKEKWAKMEDEDFEALLEDYKAVSVPVEQSGEKKREKSSFNATRETAGEGGEGDALAGFFSSGLAAAERL